MIAAATRESQQKLDKALPPNAGLNQEDAMRRKVEESNDAVRYLSEWRLHETNMRNQYIRRTFYEAKDNLSINGMDSKELETELAKAQEGEGRHGTKHAQRNVGVDVLIQKSSPSTRN